MMWECFKKQILELELVVLKECRQSWPVILQLHSFDFSNACYSFMGIGVTEGFR